MARNVDRWRFKYKLEFGTFGTKELPNGLYVEDDSNFVIKFTRRAAKKDIKPGMTDKQSGIDVKTDTILVVNKIRGDEISEFMDLDTYTVRFNGKFYKVKQVEEGVTKLVDQHFITLQHWEGNGKQPHPGRN